MAEQSQPLNVSEQVSCHLDPIANYLKERKGKRAIRKILIANNGMAATKAIMSMRRWTFVEFGSEQILTFVAMATQDDLNANAEFIRLADSFIEVPSGKNINNYANVDLICKIAKEQNVDAVWPGWGHASENPNLPATLKKMGITFIGPNSGVMAALGDKIAANILAQTAKVPSIPWSGDGLIANLTEEGTIPDEIFRKAMVTSIEDAIARAEKIGFPVMVKASEGGGGKGIRKAATLEEVKVAFENVSTEVPGSPIFMMQMCSQARHLEVQILGDEYGNTLALNGRDCSTQRRFQKIFEEGPPIVAKPDTFKEMERAAMRLTGLVRYTGAGTVEYLYNEEHDRFCFLELNPRLQVEHPVTEGITGVNLPATQLHIAMGIPLYNVPDIRSFYGLDPMGTGEIDFFQVDYPPITSHVLASRITAENPDEGFKPTSGKINSVRFQSSGDCWGYFSVGMKGGIHEFADSQFGHIFAKGVNRNEARKSLLLALKNMDISGDIRHPVDYLTELLERDDFKQNKIDTMWLDGLIAQKLVSNSRGTLEIVFYASVYRAFESVKQKTQDMISSMHKGQLVLLGKRDTDALVSFPIEIAYDGKKFSFHVTRTSADTYVFNINNTKIRAKVREQPDGSLYVSVGNSSQKIKGQEEALGLRLIIGAQTVMLPTVCDPSELRSDVNGKVVRYLHDDGAEVSKGEPYIELEAMKMIMALKSGESGKVTHAKSAGSIVSAGELLASLELKDPSKVTKIEPFEDEFSWPGCCLNIEESAEHALGSLLDGYEIGQRGPLLVEQMFQQFQNSEGAAESVRGLLEKYLANERPFAASILQKQPYDKLLLELINGGKEELDKVVLMMIAHNKLQERNGVIMAALREMVAAEGSGMSCMYVPDMKIGEDMMDTTVSNKVVEISQLPSTAGPAGDYGNARYLAQQLLDVLPEESFSERAASFRAQLEGLDEKSLDAWQMPGITEDGSLDVELMVDALSDQNPKIQKCAMQAYLQWLVAPSSISAIDIQQTPIEAKVATWTHHYPVGNEVAHNRHGALVVLLELSQIEEALSTEVLAKLVSSKGKDGEVPLNYLHIVVGSDAFPSLQDRTLFYNSNEELANAVSKCSDLFSRKTDLLRSAGVGEICVTFPQPPRLPRFKMFVMNPETEEWGESDLGQDMWPSFVNLLELPKLQQGYALQRIHKEVRPTSHIYLATQPSLTSNKMSVPELFLRGISYARVDQNSFSQCLADSLDVAVEEVEHAMLDPLVSRYGPAVTSHIYLHFVCEFDMEATEIMERFKATVNSHVGQRGAELLKLCIDEIEVKVHRSTAELVETLRLTSSSLGGGFMKPKMSREFVDPLTGEAAAQPGSMSDRKMLCTIQAKRVAARRASSMYAYDVPGLLKVALSMKWASGEPHQGDMSPSGGAQRRSPSPRGARAGSISGGMLASPRGTVADLSAMPKDILESVELVMNWEKMELQESDRPEGENDVGMLAWKITMKTPEYSEGRDIILIANDVTYQAGSFGVREDQFFQKASELARQKGLPRIYISCNSGARVGLVEELKALYKVHWIDVSDPGKGFEYLYLTKEDYEKLPSGTVEARMINEKGEERYIIDAIVGEEQKSTKGGIGVENLQGSALIAGETSRAYQETFTLSYITGRSVGIGAYLNRLGQRNIQMVSAPLLLTGYAALNKLLGKNVYSSQDQLGGPQIMAPNGVTHQVVRDDHEGLSAILDWLSFVPRDVHSLPPMRQLASLEDSWDRDVDFEPTASPYDPRDFLRGIINSDGMRLRGFFDTGSWIEYLEGWGRTVVAGRARLGGIPMGVIAVETRTVERLIPADPSNSESSEVKETNSGKVWFPDSAFKTAQALKDFGRAENLPVMIFANWRGFSGGTRDMYGEILKYGAMIVDALVEYKHPIFIYIPKHGELRGGAWVVIDPAINPEKMEMYADVESRGGILEPAGIVEVKYRENQQVEAMHRHDARLQELDAKVASTESKDEKQRFEKEIRAREKQLLPLYTSVATTFADLHDKSGRMKAKGVIREALEWKNSRRFFFWRVKRRVLQDFLINQLCNANKEWEHKDALAQVQKWAEDSNVDFQDDKQVVSWLESQDSKERVATCKSKYLKSQIERMFRELPASEQRDMMQVAIAAANGGIPNAPCSLM